MIPRQIGRMAPRIHTVSVLLLSGIAAIAARAQEASPTLATVRQAGVHAKCFASPLASEFEDAFDAGAVVALGRAENGYRQVLLPLGPVGYVHKEFATAPEQGVAKSKGTLVSFRYRPKTGEAPIARLPDQTPLTVVGELPDWWRVRTPLVEAWLPEGALQIAAEATEDLKKVLAEAEARARQEGAAWLAEVEAKREALRKEKLAKESLAAVQAAIEAEIQRPPAQQDYAPAEKKLSELKASLPEDSPLRQDVAILERRIAERRWVVEAMEASASEPVPVKDLPVVTPEVADPLERYNAVGWLRWERGLAGPGRYVVEKGGRDLFVVTCSSDRYDLSLFVNREVALVGPRRRPDADALRLLDVEKLEVLSLASR